MDAASINNIIVRELEGLTKLLGLMEEQHDFLVRNDIKQLEAIIERIDLCNKEIAEVEIERRKIVKNDSMRNVITELSSEELDTNYRKMQKMLNELKVQKETNDMLIKMGLGFSTKIMGIINPNKNNRTYNSYGKLGR